jgi:chorismate mutase/prephenate dehydratase
MEKLEKLRVEIDRVDKELSKSLEERLDIVAQIGKVKMESNIPIIDPRRASLVIEKVLEGLESKEYAGEITEIFANIIGVAETMQKKMFAKSTVENNYLKELTGMVTKRRPITQDTKVVYQGVLGSFGEVALNRYFGKNKTTVINLEEFEDVFKAVSNNEADYGVLPIENSQTGSISDIYDLFRKYRCFIVGEISQPAVQNLLSIRGAKLSDIKTVYSHMQGFLQTKAFLDKHKEFETVPMSNTAISAQYVSEQKDKTKAAIASLEAAQKYDLEVLEESINTDRNNTTRFIIISSKPECDESSKKISISFTLPNISGSLSRVLLIFAKNNLNMLKIESRPIQNKNFEYFFYVDISGNLFDEEVKSALQELATATSYFEVLGNY